MVDTVWHEFLKILTQEIGSRVVETWFKSVVLNRWDGKDKIAYLRAPNEFICTWIMSNYQDVCKKHLGRLLGEETVRIVVEVATQAGSPEISVVAARRVSDSMSCQPKQSMVPPGGGALAVRKRSKKEANGAAYTFDSFVVGPSNELAFAAAYAAAERPGSHYNPLFIYGGSGLGKTHLLHAIGVHAQRKFSEKVVLYLPAERFVHSFIQAIRYDKMSQFQAQYKKVDLLLIDDIQFISKKEQTQEAFFHIFNSLHQAHKQIVLTADCMPRDIAGLAERMRTRLEWGLVADIHMPTLETRVAILRKKAEAYTSAIEDDAFEYLAAYDFSNVRELEGGLIRVIASAALTDERVSKELISRVLANTVRKKEVVDITAIARAVCRCCHVSLQDLRSSQRTKELVAARHIAMFLMKKMTDASLREIGIFFNKKDHSTVIHAIEKIGQKAQRNSEIAQLVVGVERCIDQLNT